VLADPRREVLQQLQVRSGWPLVVVVGCDGTIKYRKDGSLNEKTYVLLRGAVDNAATDPACARTAD
jgi:hypothetical protein